MVGQTVQEARLCADRAQAASALVELYDRLEPNGLVSAQTIAFVTNGRNPQSSVENLSKQQEEQSPTNVRTRHILVRQIWQLQMISPQNLSKR